MYTYVEQYNMVGYNRSSFMLRRAYCNKTEGNYVVEFNYIERFDNLRIFDEELIVLMKSIEK